MPKATLEKKIIYILITLCIVFLIYSLSIFRPWQPFDERVFYEETLFPIPRTLSDLKEIFDSFVKNYHSESMNNFFSNHLTIRTNPFAASFVLFVMYLLKKNVLLYHLLQLFIHLLNTAFVWLILYKTSKFYIEKQNYFVFTLISLFSLTWALHSASTEAVLLVTNWDTIFTYTFCFGFMLYELTILSRKNLKVSFLRNLVITILFCLTMFFTEYAYSLPFILFFVFFAFTYKILGNLRKSFFTSVNLSLPYFTGLLLYALISLGNADSPLVNLFSAKSSFYLFIERNLWLTPQIFVHFSKLLLFPKTLSMYQPNHVHLADTLFEPYSVFCILTYIIFLMTPLILFVIFRLLKKQAYSHSPILIYAFFFSIFPFLHILLPTYCLSADRYCYFPFFFILYFIFNFIFSRNIVSNKAQKIMLSTFLMVLIVMSFRTIIRIQEWNDPVKLYKSAIKIEKNHLYKGHKLMILANYVGGIGKKFYFENYLKESLESLNKGLDYYTELIRKATLQPLALKTYGLDYNSLQLKSAFDITAIKNDNYRESPKITLAYYEPYMKNNIENAAVNQIALYAEILIKDNQIDNAESILNHGLLKYPYSSELLFLLSDIYLNHKKDLDKANEVLQKTYKYFPNLKQTTYKLFKYYEIKNDLPNLAKFSYLLGLRENSPDSYLKAAQIYLDINQLALAYKSLKKLVALTGENPVTLLLTSRYLDLLGQKDKILPVLNTAYIKNKAIPNQDIKITKSILLSLINVNANYRKWDKVKEYLLEFEQIKDLTPQERKDIFALKQRLAKTS